MSANGRIRALNLVVVQGIPIRIHWTFFLLIIWVALTSFSDGSAPLYEVLFVLALFGCVVLHELGHALTAKVFGIATRDIVLYPIGGVATLDREAQPKAELFIAAAGPLVNFVLVVLLYPLSNFTALAEQAIGTQGYFDTSNTAQMEATASALNFWGHLLIANLILGIFNLLPAFPMDGGRILRAALALLKVKTATQIAARISQLLSFALGVFAIYSGNPILILIAAFVFMSAMQEHMRARTRSAAQNQVVQSIMTAAGSFQSFTHGTTISQAFDVAVRSYQPFFPVLHGDTLLGVVDRDTLLQEAATEAEDNYLSAIMRREFSTTTPNEPLSTLIEKIHEGADPNFVVLDGGKLIGLLFRDKLYEFLMLQDIRRANSTRESEQF